PEADGRRPPNAVGRPVSAVSRDPRVEQPSKRFPTLMVDYNLISELDISDAEAESMVSAAIAETGDLSDLLTTEEREFKPGSILKGIVIGNAGDDVVIDVGFKSEGLINKNEFDDISEVKVGDEMEVLLEGIDAESGTIQLSKRKA